MGDGPIPEAWITREYVEKLRADLDEARDNERKLARYVHEAAGPESCLIPIASLVAISAETNRLRAELYEARESEAEALALYRRNRERLEGLVDQLRGGLMEILADCPIGDSRHARIARAALGITPSTEKENDAQDT